VRSGKGSGKKTAAKRPAAKRAAGKRPSVKRPSAKPPPAKRPAGKRPPTARARTLDTLAAGQDPEGFFVARVGGEEAVRGSPHPMLESGGWSEETAPPLAAYDEQLGELPWSYGGDRLVALPRDPRSLYVYWDQADETHAQALAGLDHPRVQLWLFVKGAGWERVRAIDLALEAGGWYVHDLEPGRIYRVEIHVVDRAGEDRLLRQASNEVGLPPDGPSEVVDDRFASIPWDLPLPQLVGAGAPGGPFSEALRQALARRIDWSRFRPRPAGPGAATSPTGPFGEEGR
jgi:uncharacterized protein